MTVLAPLAGVAPQALGAQSILLHDLDFAAGTDSVTAALTWAQQHMLALIKALEPETQPVNLNFRIVLRDGVALAQVFAELRDLVQSHEALRTRYLPPPAGPAQHVLSDGTLPVAVVDCGAQVGDKTVPAVLAALAGVPFDIASEWPIRVAVIVAGGLPRYVAFGLCHLEVDTTGARWIKYHLRSLLRSRPSDPRVPRTAYQMRREAEWESSPAGLRLGARAIAQHEGTFAAMPQTMLPRAAGEVPAPRYRYLEFESPSLAMVVPFLAARHNTTPATVLFAGIAAVSGFVSALPRAFLQLTVGNRVEPRLHGAVGMYTQDVPVCVDLIDASVVDVIARSTPAVMQAARFGRYPMAEMDAARKRVEADRGVAFDLSCWLNVVPIAKLAQAGDRPSAAALAQARTRTRWRWVEGTDNSTSTYFVFADGDAHALALTLILDTALLPPHEAIAWMHALERVLCESVSREVAVARIDEYADLGHDSRDGDWCLADTNWVRLSETADLVRRVSGTPMTDVFAVASAEGRRLVAFIDGSRRVPDLERLHEGAVAALTGIRTAMAPHQYVVCAGAPRVRDVSGWRQIQVLSQGTGRVSPAPAA